MTTYANNRCEYLFVDSDLRQPLNSGPISLVPIRKSHAVPIKNLLNDPEVNRFFSGQKTADEIFDSGLLRANRKSGGDLEFFDGVYVIKYKLFKKIEISWLRNLINFLKSLK